MARIISQGGVHQTHDQCSWPLTLNDRDALLPDKISEMGHLWRVVQDAAAIKYDGHDSLFAVGIAYKHLKKEKKSQGCILQS
jgi:hypothetical protein